MKRLSEEEHTEGQREETQAACSFCFLGLTSTYRYLANASFMLQGSTFGCFGCFGCFSSTRDKDWMRKPCLCRGKKNKARRKREL